MNGVLQKLTKRSIALRVSVLALSAWLSLPGAGARGQMTVGEKLIGFKTAMGLEGHEARQFSVIELACDLGPNVLWPGETAQFTFRISNAGDAIHGPATVHIVHYGTRGTPGDVWKPAMFAIDETEQQIELDVAAKKSADITITPKIGSLFGGYAMVLDLGDRGRAFAATAVRVPHAAGGRERLPTYALDLSNPSPEVLKLFKKLGVKAARMEAGYIPTDAKDFDRRMERLTKALKWAMDNDVAVMLTLEQGSAKAPLDRGRPFLHDDDSMIDHVKQDLAWLPEADGDFRKWVHNVVATYGWPKGPVNAVELWNEPWEGVSISGWGADIARYREIYTAMAQGVIDARQHDGAQVLIGGACSSSNTRDKLFCDSPTGKYDGPFLKWLDFVSIHYQPMAADPALVPEWLHRQNAYGPVQVWDTESWVANSEDRVAAVIASMRAMGQNRTAGIFFGNVYQSIHRREGKEDKAIVQAWAPAAGVAAEQQFIGQRPFKELLFHNGLPWVFNFVDAAHGDDGTLVVVGDLGGCYERARTRYRGVHGLNNAAKIAEAQAMLAKADAAKDRAAAQTALEAAEMLDGGSLTFDDQHGAFLLYDFYGNPVASHEGKIVVPLNGLGFFLRTGGTAGSFDKLCQAVRGARVEGYEPIDVEAHDLTAPIESMPTLHVTVTNILNRAVTGKLSVKLGELALEGAEQTVSIEPNQTRTIDVRVVGGSAAANNSYPLMLVFDAGADGRKSHHEILHVNYIARRTINIDGDLKDWEGVLPQVITPAQGIGASLTEKAWLPFEKFDGASAKGLSVGFLAYDDKNFYFAAKIADDTPYEGNIRFENRNDDEFFYPDTVTDPSGQKLTWPAGVRHYSYRKNPVIPTGTKTDNVQIAFNVIPADQKHLLASPPGTMPRFMCYEDTDYEYALNSVSEKFGGGTEVWRLNAPGMPRKHFFPRQPKAAGVDGGPVHEARLQVRRDGDTRVVELALPWSEIPLVRDRVLAGETIKFSFRVNNNDGGAAELAADRSVSKVNFLAFHDDWVTHWANELEFGVQK